jgi:hypothetical protein
MHLAFGVGGVRGRLGPVWVGSRSWFRRGPVGVVRSSLLISSWSAQADHPRVHLADRDDRRRRSFGARSFGCGPGRLTPNSWRQTHGWSACADHDELESKGAHRFQSVSVLSGLGLGLASVWVLSGLGLGPVWVGSGSRFRLGPVWVRSRSRPGSVGVSRRARNVQRAAGRGACGQASSLRRRGSHAAEAGSFGNGLPLSEVGSPRRGALPAAREKLSSFFVLLQAPLSTAPLPTALAAESRLARWARMRGIGVVRAAEDGGAQALRSR